jgi:hypothetical protein
MELPPLDNTTDETEKYVDLSMDDNDNDSSMEELGLTTLNYDTKTEANPPMNTPSTVSTLQDTSMESNEKFLISDNTESPFVISESSEAANEDHSESNINKKIKGRFIDPDPSEYSVKSDETPSILLEETTVSDIDSDSNETNIDSTTIKPRTPQLQNLIYKTRPNILLRYYVEDSHLRSPIAALIDKKANPLNKSKKLWKAALKPNSLLDIMVVSYDSEGTYS